MSITKKGNSYFGTNHEDIHGELTRHSKLNGLKVHKFKDIACKCGGTIFTLHIDDEEYVASRKCMTYNEQHLMLDGEEYMDKAELYQAICTCKSETFEITVGVNLYSDKNKLTNDVHWLYIGCRCPKCNQIGCYADWKNESLDYEKFLSNA